MAELDPGIADCRALVVDGNPTSRSVIVAQLRDFGVQQVYQASRPHDARRMLEYREFDIVLCEQRFPESNYTGQELLDDLRRAQLLPFSTVFVMLTAEASYAQVAEAAESALDSYLLKPHTAATLGQRLIHARKRKRILAPIFEAIERGDFEQAARLCLQRYQAREHYWLYAARIGAELLLRLGRAVEAQKLYESILSHNALPWAKLGVARAQVEEGKPTQAMATLQALASEDAGYADAYDVMGRIHVEQGRFEEALKVYRQACEVTPSSIARLQKRGMLAFYLGEVAEAAKSLDRATVLGLSSKMYDHQALMLLVFCRVQQQDTQGVRRCVEQFERALERKDHAPRLKRMKAVADTLLLLLNKQVAAVVSQVRQMGMELMEPAFDVEAACNFVSLLAELARAELALEEATAWLQAVGLRFCSTRSVTELLAGAARAHPPYVALMHEGSAQVADLAQAAMTHVVAGDPRAAVLGLLAHGQRTCNIKLLDLARLTLQRYHDRIEDADALKQRISEPLQRYAPSAHTPNLGQSQGRSAGGLTLRTAAEPPRPSPPRRAVADESSDLAPEAPAP